MNEEKIIRIEDYGKHREVHEKIIQILNSSGVSCYNAIGILETIKQEIFIKNLEDSKNIGIKETYLSNIAYSISELDACVLKLNGIIKK